MTQYHKIVCDLCKEETKQVYGQIAIGKMDIEGKPVDILEVCDKCRAKLIEQYSLKEFREEPAEEPQPEATE